MHIHHIFGLPGPFTDVCRDMALDLLTANGRAAAAVEIAPVNPDTDPEQRDLDCLGSLATALLNEEKSEIIAVARVPDRAYVDAVCRTGSPFLVALADPRRVALYLHSGAGLEPMSAVRVTGASCACLVGTLLLGRANPIWTDDLTADTARLATCLLSVLRLPADAANVARAREIVARRLDGARQWRMGEEDVSTVLRTALPEESAFAVEAALAGYVPAFSGEALGHLTATRALFYSTETSAPLVTSTIDVTGRPRCLVYGPYISLPPGNWTLQLVLAFSKELAGMPFTLEVSRGDRRGWSEVGRVSFVASVGRYVGQVSFNHQKPDTTLQFKLLTDKAAFDGQVSVGFAELSRFDERALGNVDSQIEWRPPALADGSPS